MTGRNADADLKIIELHSPPKIFSLTQPYYTPFLQAVQTIYCTVIFLFGNLLKLKQFIYYFVNKSLTEYANYGII